MRVANFLPAMLLYICSHPVLGCCGEDGRCSSLKRLLMLSPDSMHMHNITLSSRHCPRNDQLKSYSYSSSN